MSLAIIVGTHLEYNVAIELNKQKGGVIAIVDKTFVEKILIGSLKDVKTFIVEFDDFDSLPIDFSNHFDINEYNEYLKYSKIIADSHIRNQSLYLSHELIEDNILRLYLFWNKFIFDNNINCVVRLGAVPHFPSELSLYYLLKVKRKRFVFSWHSGIKNIVYFSDDFNELQHEINKIGKLTTYDYAKKELKLMLQNAVNQPNELTPNYMKISRVKHHYKLVRYKFLHLKLVIKGRKNLTRIFINIIYARFILNGHKYMKMVKKCSSGLPNEKFIYIPLHMNPEATTLPLGDIYYRLEVYITSLLSILPNNLKVVIKEHPMQTSKSRLYRHINLMQNSRIHLVNNHVSTYDLIIKSEFVVSITGTVILEASLLGKRTLMLGYNLYNLLPNVVHIEKFSLEKLISPPDPIKIESFEPYLKTISNIGFESKYLSEPNEALHDQTEIEQITNQLISFLFNSAI